MKIALVAAALILPAAAAGIPPSAEPSEPAREAPGESSTMPNVARPAGPGCVPILQQVQEESKRRRDNEARTLDREPPAHLLLAVDRRVNGCREVTFVRRNVGPQPERGR